MWNDKRTPPAIAALLWPLGFSVMAEREFQFRTGHGKVNYRFQPLSNQLRVK